MGYNIGIDFGTTNTVISYWDGSRSEDNSPRIEGFKYPAQNGSIFIPSVVNYENGFCDVGSFALTTGNYIKAMKMFLPMSYEERRREGWNVPEIPEEVIADFFKKLLKKGEKDSFETRIGPIKEVVLCVPHVWNNELDHSGRAKMKEIFNSLGFKVKRIVSEPVAASSYFINHYENLYRSKFKGNLLVFDLGGGTFDVTLCHVSENGKIEGIRNEGNGTTRDIKGKAGVLFDETLINLAYKRANDGQEIEEEDFQDLYSTLQDLKVLTPPLRVKTKIVEAEAQKADADRDSIAIFRARKLKMCYTDVMASFTEIELGIHQVLKRIKANSESLDAYFLTGGFNQFYLCRRAILNYYDLQEDSSKLHDAAIDSSIAGKSISFGATLIANDLVNIDERYPHTIGFIEYSKGDIQKGPQKKYVELIVGGKLLREYSAVVFHEQEYRKMSKKRVNFELYVDFNGDEKNRKEFSLKDIDLPNEKDPNNYWQVGMKMDFSEVIYVVFRDKNKETTDYKLSNITQFEGKLIAD